MVAPPLAARLLVAHHLIAHLLLPDHHLAVRLHLHVLPLVQIKIDAVKIYLLAVVLAIVVVQLEM
jgi:hypothetical protein